MLLLAQVALGGQGEGLVLLGEREGGVKVYTLDRLKVFAVSAPFQCCLLLIFIAYLLELGPHQENST